MSKRPAIPNWKVQQAFPIERYPFPADTWFAVTQKMNGVRATFYRGQMIGRNGTVIPGLEHIESALSKFQKVVFDGELVLQDSSGLTDNEAFRKATGIINSDSENKSEIQFMIFDVILLDEFESGKSTLTYKQRSRQLGSLAGDLRQYECVKILPVLYEGTDQSKVETLLNEMVAQDKEGIIVNLDTPYMRTRHKGILKVKRFYTMDLPILRCEEGLGKVSGMLGSLIVQYEDSEVGVGSGFTNEERIALWNKRDKLAGTLVEVKYKDISYDKKTGKKSLQFPIFVRIRDDKTEVSYG